MRWMWLCGWNIIVAGEVKKIASIKRLDSFNTHYFQVFHLGMREYNLVLFTIYNYYKY